MIEVVRHTLSNGLRLVANYDPTASMAAVNVLYGTGARDEVRSATGIAHLFEHLMFGGSVNVPGFDLELGAAGGRSNAWTSNDFTNFYDILPSVNIETALHLESDRMLGLTADPQPLEVQRRVVIEEFKQQCLNTPYGDLMHHLRAAAYSPEHPYSWPVIGLTPDHIAAVSADDVKRRHAAWYTPSNAVIAISGRVPVDMAVELTEKWFGDLPARQPAARHLPDPGFPDETVDITVRGNAPVPCVAIGIPMDAYGTMAYRAADVITDILSAGEGSRIYREIVAGGDGSVVSADASILGSEHPGLLLLTARLASEGAADAAIERLTDALAQLGGAREATPRELERAFNRFEATLALDNLSVAGRAFNMALAEMHGEDVNGAVGLQRSVTAADVAETAARLSGTPRVVLRYFNK